MDSTTEQSSIIDREESLKLDRQTTSESKCSKGHDHGSCALHTDTAAASLLDYVLDSGCQHCKFFRKKEKFETDVSREIKVLAEVEKIWIIFDIDDSGELEIDEVKEYLKKMAFPHLNIHEEDVQSLFDEIDTDKSGTIDK